MSAADAYGERDPDAVQEIAKDMFGDIALK